MISGSGDKMMATIVSFDFLKNAINVSTTKLFIRKWRNKTEYDAASRKLWVKNVSLITG